MAKRRSKSRPAPKQVQPHVLVRRAVKFGADQANALLSRPMPRRLTAAGAPDNGIVVAEGDSWFNYPLHDVLERLEEQFGFRVESVAHQGDSAEQMAYDPAQGAALARLLQRLKDDGKTPRAILLSAGGNDIAGDQFGMLINHVNSGLPVLNTQIVNGVINERLMFAYGCLIGRINQMTQTLFPNPVPIVIHGYAHAVPDGRGFLGGTWFLPGPWLRPGFDQKGHTDRAKNRDQVANLLDQLNAMLQSLPTFPNIQNTTYLDLRGVLNNNLPTQYKQDWANELHPTPDGFERLAKHFSDQILLFPKP